MTGLSGFLLARIAEDERYAHHARGEDDKLDGTPFGNRYRAKRVLAECDAKRRIAGVHSLMYGEPDGDGATECNHCGHSWPCFTLCALSLPYADHPDYREEWRP